MMLISAFIILKGLLILLIFEPSSHTYLSVESMGNAGDSGTPTQRALLIMLALYPTLFVSIS